MDKEKEDRLRKTLFLYGITCATDTSKVKISESGLITVDDDVSLNSATRLFNGILPFHFHFVSGDFDIPNDSLKSLVGVPKFIGGVFNIPGPNHFESLIGFPKNVNGGVYFGADFETTEENFLLLNACVTPSLKLNISNIDAYERFITIKQIIQ